MGRIGPFTADFNQTPPVGMDQLPAYERWLGTEFGLGLSGERNMQASRPTNGVYSFEQMYPQLQELQDWQQQVQTLPWGLADTVLQTPYDPETRAQALSGYNVAPRPSGGGITYYSSPGLEASSEAHSKALEQLYGSVNVNEHHSSDKQYRRARDWGEWWRQAVDSSLEGEDAMDPLAQLQNQLQSEVSPNISGLMGGMDISGQIAAQNQAVAGQLQQRQAGMGMEDLYSPLIAQQRKMAPSSASQAMAAYRPQAWTTEQQYQDQMTQQLQQLQQMEFMGNMAIQSAGR